MTRRSRTHPGSPTRRPRLSQRFLRDPRIARRIVEAVAPDPEDVLLEIGPGEGALTQHLAGAVRALLLVEVDPRLCALLRSRFGGLPGVDLLEGDILQADLTALARRLGGPLRVVGNIPYHITSPILMYLIAHRKALKDATLMVQREVARRLASSPGTKEYGALTLAVQGSARADLLFLVPPGAFSPPPRVHSAVVRLTFPRVPPVAVRDPQLLERVVRASFEGRRKQLRTVLLGRLLLCGDRARLRHLEEASGIDLRRRGETLSLGEFVRLADALLDVGGLATRKGELSTSE